METREMFSFFSYCRMKFFITKHISNHIIKYVFYLDSILQYFYKYHRYHLSIQQKLLNLLNTLSLKFFVCQFEIDIFLLMDLQRINKFYQYLIHYLYDQVMHLSFHIKSLQLIIFCMDDQEFLAILDFALLFLLL